MSQVKKQFVDAIGFVSENQPIAVVIGVGAVGGAIARLLAHSYTKHHFILVGRNESRAQTLAKDLWNHTLCDASVIACNVAEEGVCTEIAAAFIQENRTIAVLILAAGEAILDTLGEGQELSAVDANMLANYYTKIRPLWALHEMTHAVIMVSSIARTFSDDDPRMRRQHGYRAALQKLANEVEELRRTTCENECKKCNHWIQWDCPLVQGATADVYVRENIVSADTKIPSADDVVVRELMNQFIAFGLYDYVMND